MQYAILDVQNDVNAMSRLLYGSLQDIADSVSEQCDDCNPGRSGTLDLDALDKEGFYYEADDYIALNKAACITPDLFMGFHFTLSGAKVSVYCLAEGYPAFHQAFKEYDGRDFWLEELCLPEVLAPEEEEAFAEELAAILFNGEQFGELARGRRFVTKKAKEE